jgi:SH3-like domain-containing protein
MKTIHRLTFRAVLMAGLVSTLASAQETAVVKAKTANVRGQPRLKGEVVTKLKEGDPVTVLEEINVDKPRNGDPAKWYRIVLPANTPVWVNGAFVDPTNKTILPKRLNLRSGPSESHSVLGLLERGATIKEIRQVDNWLEIEAPTNAYAFIAAEVLTGKETSPLLVALPLPAAPAPAPITPAPTPPVKEVAPANPPPAVVEKPIAPPPAAETRPPPAESPAVASPPATPAAPSLPAKRVVRREGLVKPTISIQAPTYYELRSIDTGKPIDFLYTTSTNFVLKNLKGKRIFVTGEEFLDKRWADIPVLEIETIEILP